MSISAADMPRSVLSICFLGSRPQTVIICHTTPQLRTPCEKNSDELANQPAATYFYCFYRFPSRLESCIRKQHGYIMLINRTPYLTNPNRLSLLLFPAPVTPDPVLAAGARYQQSNFTGTRPTSSRRVSAVSCNGNKSVPRLRGRFSVLGDVPFSLHFGHDTKVPGVWGSGFQSPGLSHGFSANVR